MINRFYMGLLQDRSHPRPALQSAGLKPSADRGSLFEAERAFAVETVVSDYGDRKG